MNSNRGLDKLRHGYRPGMLRATISRQSSRARWWS